MLRSLISLSLVVCLAVTALAQAPFASQDASKELHALFDEDWQWRLREYPESATWNGDARYNDRLTDLSFEAIERAKAHDREMLERVKKIDRSKLAGQDVISYDLFLRDKQLDVEGQRFPTELMPITQIEGVQLAFPQLVATMPFDSEKGYRDYLARLAAFPKYIDQTIALLARGIEKGWVQPAAALRGVPAQIDGQIVEDPTKSVLFEPFNRIPVTIADRDRLTAAGRKAVGESVMPALKKLGTFFKETYLPAARREVGISSVPDGPNYYAYAARRMTTTNLTPKEIHELGKREVARIRAEMDIVMKRTGFTGSFQEFLTCLRTDPRFYYTKPEDLVAGYRDVAKRADAELPKLFAELPRNSYGVKEFSAFESPSQTTARYFPGAADASRAGFFMVNTYKLETRPKYEMEALTLHEAVPGHHLQIARAKELRGLPEFRRNGGETAFVEGWALYAESLGTEMGFYTDPYSKFGQLSYEMWRACRLVVDTGMHAFGWSRQQAIDYMKDNTAKSENDIIVEIDRYIGWPGQALAYKIGELKIKELRARATRELGPKFDLRGFHNALLDNGALPLEILEKQIDRWIDERKRESGK